MKAIVLILLLMVSAAGQDVKEWKFIKELSGDIPNYPGLTAEFYAAEIARGDNVIKLAVRMDLPQGAPYNMLKDNVPRGFDVSSITRMVAKTEFNCDTLVMKLINGSAQMYRFNGKRFKSKEPPFNMDSGHIFVKYFCERSEVAPTTPPKLKPKP